MTHGHVSGGVMDLKGMKLGRIFVALGLLDEDQERAALEYARQWSIPFGRACVKMGFLDEDLVVRALSMQAGTPSVSLASIEVPMDVLDLVPKKIAEKHRVLPVSVVDSAKGRGTLVVAASAPLSVEALDELRFSTGRRIELVIASDAELDAALFRFYAIDLDRHIRSHQMVDFEAADAGEAIVHDRLELTTDFLDHHRR